MMTYLRVIHAAIRRHHLERSIRDQFQVSSRQARMPFEVMLSRLTKEGKITEAEKTRIRSQYRYYSKMLHGGYR